MAVARTDPVGALPASPNHPQFGVLQFMDVLRGLAAAYVMLGHSLQYLWAGAGSLGAAPLVIQAAGRAAGLLNFGHKAVILFFVISGFCIHYRQAAQGEKGPAGVTFKVLPFARRRVRRLYPPLLLAMALTLLFDAVGKRVNLAFYEEHGVFAYTHSIEAIVGNALMQADFLIRYLGSNLPLWSLTYEFWFYVGYPILLVVVVRRGPTTTLNLLIVLALVGLLLSAAWPTSWPPTALAYWVVWGMGAFLAEVYWRNRDLSAPLLALPAILIVAGAWWFTRAVILADILVGAGLTLALWAIVRRAPWPGHHLGFLRHVEGLGHMSYSLYLTHFPIIFLISAVWRSNHRDVPVSLGLFLVGVIASLSLGYASYLLVEKRFTRRQPPPEAIAAP